MPSCRPCPARSGSARPVRRPSWLHAMTPAAGPDSTRCAGFRAAIAGGSVPPLDCMISSGASIPAPRSAVRERVDVPADDGAEVRVDDGGARALVLADLGEDVGRPRDEDVVGERSRAGSPRPGVRGRRRRTSGAARSPPPRLAAPRAAPRRPERSLVERSPDLASRAEALAHLEAKRAGHERRRLLVLQVVEHGIRSRRISRTSRKPSVVTSATRRAATLRGRRSTRRWSRAPRRRCPRRDLRVALETANAGDDAFGVVGGRGEDLRRPDRAVGAEEHDVRERPADVDADAERPHGTIMSHITSTSGSREPRETRTDRSQLPRRLPPCGSSPSPPSSPLWWLVPIRHKASRRRSGARGVEVFQGLGTWIDIYDTALYRMPDAVAGRLAARGVRTAWVETANDRSAVDVVDPFGLGRLVDSLHARGITVVAWYLPGHDRQARDLRRTRAMLSFRTPQGGCVRRGRARHRVAAREERQAANGADARPAEPPPRRGRLHAGRRDHVSAASVRAAPQLVARLPVGRDRAARRCGRADALHGRRLQGLRRDLRLRRPLASAPARGGRRSGRGARGGRRREPDDGGGAARVHRCRARRRDRDRLEPLRPADDDARGLGRDGAPHRLGG